MNERLFENVKRLYDESAAQCHEGSAWEWELKFAELIIKECADIALREEFDAHDCILKHFGVE